MSKAATQLEDVLEPRFPGIRFGRYNCRRISGSTTFSQHAWPGGNARDIYAPVNHPDPADFLDRVDTYLEHNTQPLSIRLVLWRVQHHYDHIHADFYPTGHDIPPCAGGRETWRYSDGIIVEEHDPDPENGYYEEAETMFVKQGDHSMAVEYWQNHLAYIDGQDISQSATLYLPAMTPPMVPRLYDANMAAHIRAGGYGNGTGIGAGEAMRILKDAYEKGDV